MNESKIENLIAEEKQAFLKSDGARVSACMGREYWDEKAKCSRVFHPLPEGWDEKAVPNPDDLSLEELALLPELEERLLRAGTVSFTALLRLYPDDKKRLKLWRDIDGALKSKKPGSPQWESQLFEGHGEYMASKTGDDVVVIM